MKGARCMGEILKDAACMMGDSEECRVYRGILEDAKGMVGD